MIRRKFLIDLDHTIFASWPRDAMIGGEGGWDAYHAASVDDAVIKDVVDLVNALVSVGWTAIGLTARPEKWRALSMKKLTQHSVRLDELLMRPDEAFHPAPEIKVQLAQNRFGSSLLDQVAFLLEDREDVCEAFHTLGITTMQVRGRHN